MLHKSSKNIGKNVEFKDEERGLLCSNIPNVRSSSLCFTPNSESASEDDMLDYLANIYLEIADHILRNNP
jgi:hypothetical protein